ncbi:hypothetical protein CJY59_04520 [Campylobacter coli]|nr:hypothetical protein [Campylobacter coli]
MTSVLLSQSLHAISIGGKDEFFANKDLSIPVINTNKAVGGKIKCRKRKIKCRIFATNYLSFNLKLKL